MTIRMTWPMYRRRQVEIDGRLIKLAPCETEIIAVLLMRRGQFVPRADILEVLWPDPDAEPGFPEKVIDILLYRLRRKLGSAAIETCIGLGWAIPA